MIPIVTLNVGGVLYTTTKDTLLKHQSFFTGLLSDNFSTTLDDKGNIFIDRNGELFKYVLEFLRTNVLPKRALADRALLEELLQEAEFYCIEELVTEINSKLNPARDYKKIYIWELEDYLKEGFYVVGTGIGPFQYHQCPHGHDPDRIDKNRFLDSKCRHSHVELVEEYVPFVIVSTSIPVVPVFNATSGGGEKKILHRRR